MVVIIQIIMLIYGLYHGIYGFISGWWLTYPSEKYELVKVSWDDYIPNIWKNIKVMFQTTNQDSIFHFKGRTHRLIEIVMMNQWME